MSEFHQATFDFSAPPEPPKEKPPETKEDTPSAPINALETPPLPRAPSEYERRQEEKRERLLERADKAKSDSTTAFQASCSAVAGIEPGQPVLIGHHSEKKHRRDLERSDSAMRRSVEQSEKAKELERRAKAVGTGGISSDDSNALLKLQEKLTALEERREYMKKINGEFRRGGIEALSCTDETKAKLTELMSSGGVSGVPFEPYQLTNLGAQIRSTKKRIEELQQEEQREPAANIVGDGFVVSEDQSDNRILFRFEKKPPQETRELLKSRGFQCSPSRDYAWVRKLNENARSAAASLVASVRWQY